MNGVSPSAIGAVSTKWRRLPPGLVKPSLPDAEASLCFWMSTSFDSSAGVEEVVYIKLKSTFGEKAAQGAVVDG